MEAAKGIPAWRESLLVPLSVVTALTEGGGVFLLTAPLHGAATESLTAAFGVLVIARVLAWLVYRRRLDGKLATGADTALDRAGRVLQLAGTLAPLALIAMIGSGIVAGEQILVVAAVAGQEFAFEVNGDIRSQLAANHVCAGQVVRMIEEYGLENLDRLADEIIGRSERSIRASIARVPAGVYRADGIVEQMAGQPDVRICCAVSIEGSDVTVDPLRWLLLPGMRPGWRPATSHRLRR